MGLKQSLGAFLKKNPAIKKAWYSFLFRYRGNKIINKGHNNKVIINSAFLKGNTFIFGGSNNTIILGDDASILGCTVRMPNNKHYLSIGAKTVCFQVRFHFEDDETTITVGENSSIRKDSELSSVEKGGKVIIGNRCRLANDVEIRNSDSHSIIDTESRKRINFGKDVVFEDHIWMAGYVKVLKGVTIGKSTIVGIGSVVSKSLPNNSLCAGVPAKVLRGNITWCYDRVDENYIHPEID